MRIRWEWTGTVRGMDYDHQGMIWIGLGAVEHSERVEVVIFRWVQPEREWLDNLENPMCRAHDASSVKWSGLRIIFGEHAAPRKE